MGIGFQKVSHISPPMEFYSRGGFIFPIILMEHSKSTEAFYGEEEQDAWRGSQRE